VPRKSDTRHLPPIIDARHELLRTDLLGVGGALEHRASPTAQGGCDGEAEGDSLRISHCRCHCRATCVAASCNLCLHRLSNIAVEDISSMGTGTNLDIAATDQTRPIAITTTSPMIPMRICNPLLSSQIEDRILFAVPM